jgi:hypothetical protein
VKRLLPIVFLLVSVPLFSQDWGQWGFNPQHSSQVPYQAQELNRNLVNLVYDTLTQQEMTEAGALYGEPVLLAHFQAPLIDGDNVYMMRKTGQYTNYTYFTEKWSEMRLHWENGTLVEKFDFQSDWNPPGSAYYVWEPVFHPALANGYLYIPGAGGSIFKVDKLTGVAVTRINPFPTSTGDTTNTIFTASPITVDSKGNLYYNAMQFHDAINIFQNDVVDSWLVKIDKFDHISKVSYSELTVGAPAATDLCLNAFPTRADQTIVNGPWPPSADAVPGSVTCGAQRPGINVAPAISADGKTLYTVTRAHFISRWGYVVAVNLNNLSQKWISSLRERFRDGCGVPISLGGTLPPNGMPGGCRAGARYGVDPATNGYGGGRVLDDSSSTPTIAPDGSILYGAYSRYNYAQGHMMRFSPSGEYLGGYNFGWDITPGIFGAGSGYAILTKDNHYGETGSYCNDPTFCPDDESGRAYPEAYFISSLSPTLRADALADRGDKLMSVNWSFQNTNTQSCSRAADGSVTCVSDHPNSFEWCVNAFAIDKNGVAIANSEDGFLFALNPDGTLRKKIFQQLALGAAYTPTSIGADGKVYSQNAGHLFVAGN